MISIIIRWSQTKKVRTHILFWEEFICAELYAIFSSFLKVREKLEGHGIAREICMIRRRDEMMGVWTLQIRLINSLNKMRAMIMMRSKSKEFLSPQYLSAMGLIILLRRIFMREASIINNRSNTLMKICILQRVNRGE